MCVKELSVFEYFAGISFFNAAPRVYWQDPAAKAPVPKPVYSGVAPGER